MGDKRTLGEFMNENKTVNRWFVLAVGLVGAFMGALLTIAFVMFGFV